MRPNVACYTERPRHDDSMTGANLVMVGRKLQVRDAVLGSKEEKQKYLSQKLPQYQSQ